MSAALIGVFYELSSALLTPIMILLLAGLAVSLAGCGAHLAELLQRLRDRPIRRAIGEHRAQVDPERVSGYLGRLLRALAAPDGQPDLALASIETHMQRRVGRASLLVRLGPTVGLMGTLVPMGPALTDLAAGRIEQMAGKLVIAFATTVVGLAIGAIAAVIVSVRRRWYDADLRLCDLLIEQAGREP